MSARYTCALCGRRTVPFVFVGLAAIGPKCAQRANLTPSKAPRGSLLKFAGRVSAVKRDDPKTLDLFPDL